MIRRIGQCWKRMWAQETGTAAVEFALILPFMLLLYIGTVEASSLISTDRKVQTVTGAIGDLVARSDSVITQSQLNDYFQAASGIMSPTSSTKLKQVVTSVKVPKTGNPTVIWSRGYNGGVARNVNTTVALPNEIVTISRGKTVILAETSMQYEPLVNLIYASTIPLYRANFFMPRFGAGIDLK